MTRPPVIATYPAVDVTRTTATLVGVVTDPGENGPGYICFGVGETVAYENSTPIYGYYTPWQGITIETEYRQLIEGLTPSTTYHYCIIGQRGELKSYGDDVAFTTLPAGVADWTTIIGPLLVLGLLAAMMGMMVPAVKKGFK